MNLKRILLTLLILLFIIISFNIVNAEIGGSSGEVNNSSITLIKEHIDAHTSNNGDENCYYIYGVLNNLPDNVYGYTVMFQLYDGDGTIIERDYGDLMESIAQNSKKSEPTELGVVFTDRGNYAKDIELLLYDNNGKVVFAKNITWNGHTYVVKSGKVKCNNSNNINLIKERIDAHTSNNGDENCYYIYGVLNNLPDNVYGYTVMFQLYDGDGTIIERDYGDLMESIAQNSKKSEPTELGVVFTDRGNYAKDIELLLYDNNGKVVFTKNITFDGNVKYIESSETNYDSDDLDSSNSSKNSVTPLFREFTPEEQRKADYYYDKYLADNA